MKIAFTIQFLLLSLFCFCQPVITTDIVPETGKSYKGLYNEGTIDLGPSGANQTWDYSELTAGFEVNFSILEPENAPGFMDYPDAEFVWNLVEFENYLFYDVTDNVISQLGGVNGVVGDISFQTINTDWEDGFQLPLTYLDSYDFLTIFDNYLFGNYLSSGQRNATLTADSYGTIMTPFGTYENVLRVVIERDEFIITSTQYAWLHPESFLPVMVYETDSDGETVDSYYFTDINAVVSSTKNVDSEDNLLVSQEQGRLIINGLEDANYTMQLMDYVGQRIQTSDSRIGPSSWQVEYKVYRELIPAVLVIGNGKRTWTKKVYLY
ncbi:MAG: hypothetical protein AAGA77_07000 [Bacteroidota bacterium]